MIQSLPTYLAAQRTPCTIEVKQQYYSSPQSWTAGRCRRLLRPIISRIELLRKDFIRYTPVIIPDSLQIPGVPATAPSYREAGDSSVCEEEDKYCAKGRKRVRRTYSARSKHHNVPSRDQIPGGKKEKQGKPQGRKARLRPGEFLVPTPILNRSKSLITDSSRKLHLDQSMLAPLKSNDAKRPRSRCTAKDQEAHSEVTEAMRRIKATTNTARFKLYEGICNSLEALFKATMPHEEQVLFACETNRTQLNTFSPAPKVPHSRSLFAMCLRGVPDYIKEEEKQFEIEADTNGQKLAFSTPSVLTETYSGLESLGTSEMGWKHLKTVVRAHGVFVISDAIENGLLDVGIASALVMLCIQTSLPDEAEILLTSLLKASTYPDPKSPQSHFRDHPALLPLLTLEKFVKYTGRICYYHRQITNIITSGSLPVTWLGTRHFISIWMSLFHSLSIDPHDRDATKFMTSVLPLLYRAPLSSFENHKHSSSDQTSMLSVLDATWASVLTTLLAMSMLSISHGSVSQTLKATIIDCKLGYSGFHSHAGALILVANLLGSRKIHEDAGFFKKLVRLLRSKPCKLLNPRHSNDPIPSFICSVASCCGRGSSGDGFEHLQTILGRLIAISSLDSSNGSGVVEQMVVDSASIFADHLPDPKHVQYAQYVRAHTYESFIQPKISPSKGRPIPETGFRWEEGINEWVMATPAFRLEGTKERRLYLADEDSYCDNPISFKQQHCKTETVLLDKRRVLLNRYNRISDFAPDSPEEHCEDIDSQVRKDSPTQNESLRAQYLLRALPKLRSPVYSGRNITKRRRLGCELLWSNPKWMLFEHSDDELNSSTETSLDLAQGTLDEPSDSIRCFGSASRRKSSMFDKRQEGRGGYLEEQSEDELGL